MWKRNFLPMALLLPIVFGMTPKKAASPSAEPKTRVFEFTYKTQVSATANAKELRLWLPYPTTDGHQEIYDMQLVSPVAATVYKEPKYRNSILFVSVPNPGSGPITVEMR